MKNLNYLMVHKLYQIFKIILNTSLKSEKVADNLSIKIYVSKIENRNKFKKKAG